LFTDGSAVAPVERTLAPKTVVEADVYEHFAGMKWQPLGSIARRMAADRRQVVDAVDLANLHSA